MTCFQLYVTADPDQQLQKNLAKRNRSIGHIRSRFKIRSFFYNKQFDEFDTFRSWRLILFHGIEQKIIEKDFFKPMSISCPKKNCPEFVKAGSPVAMGSSTGARMD